LRRRTTTRKTCLYEYSGEGTAECYQFDTLEELQECARAYQEQPRMIAFSIVTHSGQYKNTHGKDSCFIVTLQPGLFGGAFLRAGAF
jgi:hypothetical protein